MIKKEYKVIGVMSGTSLDGIDLLYASFKIDAKWSFNIIHAETVNYDKNWFHLLKNLVSLSLSELKNIDKNYTSYLVTEIKAFIDKNNIRDIDAICSHGHTALHQPENGVTYQIGNRSELASLLGKTVVCDFRVQDVTFGGQGAPLVPVGDRLLFSEYDFCINLGGFANISSEINQERIAYDVCPVNIVLNHYAKQLGFDYDNDGALASQGSINQELLGALNDLDFYKKKPPKSLGLEWVNEKVIPIIDAFKLEIKDVLRTFVEHVAIQISKGVDTEKKSTLFLTGGGFYNGFLIKRLKKLTKNEIIIPSNEIVEYKEALIFGFLGILKLRNEINCLSSVTGASHNHSTGIIFYPQKLM